MNIFHIIAAATPIVLLLILMIVFKWSGKRAGLASWLAALVLSAVFFGLTPQVFLVSQLKGLIFSAYVLGVLWPALLLYHLNHQIGGIKALTEWLSSLVADRSHLNILIAWIFTGILEGIAGFGLPIAVAAPMLISLGVPALLSVAAAAIGHAWSVTFGNMGMVFQSLVSLSGYPEPMIVPYAAILMGICCLLTGLAVAHLLGELHHWRFVIGIAVIMSLVQYLVAASGLLPLSGFGASLTGLVVGIVISRKGKPGEHAGPLPKPLVATLGSYAFLAVITLVIFIQSPIRRFLFQAIWQQGFPEVVTRIGFVTPAGYAQAFRWFAYPGTIILIAIMISYAAFRSSKIASQETFKTAITITYSTAFPVTLGILATVGLSVMMDHTGMTQLLAVTMSRLTGRVFPLISPVVGMIGAFATGSNTNSNVLFVSLQKQVAELISVLPVILIAAQTAGGSLGSMIAPAKVMVGCSNAGMIGQEGLVLKTTLPYAIAIGLSIGLAGLILSHLPNIGVL